MVTAVEIRNKNITIARGFDLKQCYPIRARHERIVAMATLCNNSVKSRNRRLRHDDAGSVRRLGESVHRGRKAQPPGPRTSRNCLSPSLGPRGRAVASLLVARSNLVDESLFCEVEFTSLQTKGIENRRAKE